MNRLPPVGLLGGRELAVLRYLQRWGQQERDALFTVFVEGNRSWYPEDLDRAISALVERGYVHEPDEDGFVSPVLRVPL